MRIISLNVNGIRAAHRKGLNDFLNQQQADVVCLQELKAHPDDIPALPDMYSLHSHCATRKGYSGVAILSKHPPEAVHCGINQHEFDTEGRVIRADYKNTSVISVYVPSGSSRDDRQEFKMRFLDAFQKHTQALLAKGRNLIICGDLNIAHQAIDLKNWRSNQKNSGFLPEERTWFSNYLNLGLHDAYRDYLGPDTASYSWWSQRGGARDRNVGWRLDYQLSTPDIATSLTHATIPRTPHLSDHAPVIMDYTTTLT